MKIVAVANQKGGVGKTTTALNLAAAVALNGYKTLIIDIDPQANVTSGLGVDKGGIETSVYAALIGEKTLRDIIRPTGIENLSIAPSGIDLVGAEIELSAIDRRESRMKEALVALEHDYDFVFFDCPALLGSGHIECA
jgi:chromosome partitioning protein